jgi:hypothetical protein
MTLLLALSLGFLAGLVYGRTKLLSFLLLIVALLLAGGFISIDW